jgi:hypothetical protein
MMWIKAPRSRQIEIVARIRGHSPAMFQTSNAVTPPENVILGCVEATIAPYIFLALRRWSHHLRSMPS